MKHTVRTKDNGFIELEITRNKAIKLFCTECMGWEGNIKECTSTYCPLYPYRGRTLVATSATRSKKVISKTHIKKMQEARSRKSNSKVPLEKNNR
jgi:hypothetical protein